MTPYQVVNPPKKIHGDVIFYRRYQDTLQVWTSVKNISTETFLDFDFELQFVFWKSELSVEDCFPLQFRISSSSIKLTAVSFQQ